MKQATVKIVSIWSKDKRSDPPPQYEIKVDAEKTDKETLENAFMLTNRDDRPYRENVCATTCGDLMEFNGQHYFVDRYGFKRITPEQSMAVRKLDSKDTAFGWDWLVRNGLVPTP